MVETEQKPTRILVVDDDDHVRRATARMLRDSFYVAVASCAGEALALLDGAAFDVVLTDNDMAGGSGLSLLQRVRERCPSVRRILISGGVPSDLSGHLASGLVERFVAKPASGPDLRAILVEMGFKAI